MKRAIITVSALVVLFVILLSINELTGSENEVKNNVTASPDPEVFLIGAYSAGCSPNNVMNQLGFNIWHRFLVPNTYPNSGYNQKIFPAGFTRNDNVFAGENDYLKESVKYYRGISRLNDNYIYLTRPRLEMLTFAQRSDYNPCNIPLYGSTDKGYWWYGYNIHETGTDVEENGKWLRKCNVNRNSAGYIVKELRPSMEQSNDAVPNYLFRDANYSWYVKPSVKIPVNTPRGTKIFRVEIYRKDSTLLRSVDVFRENFDKPDSLYKGGYIDEFFPASENPLYIQNGADLYGNPSYDQNQPKNDYAVYWYGNCDMYLEHVRVENDWAHKLFSGEYDVPGNAWIKEDVENLAYDGEVRSYKYLVDESEHNMYPAITYINEKIREYRKPDSKLSLTAISNIVYLTPFLRPLPGKPWMWNVSLPVDVIKENFRKSGMNEVFIDLYPVYADRFWYKDLGKRQYIPSTLKFSDYNVSEGRLGERASPEVYENNFNTNLDQAYHHYFEFMKYSNAVSREFNVPIIAAVQIHSWYNGAETSYSLREPTNEEIELLTGIPITYGAKGIIFHAYNSIGAMGNNMYSRGLVGNYTEVVNEGNQCDDMHKREINAYGQEKWKKIVALSSKLKKLGKEIVNFDNSRTFSYRLNVAEERTELYSNSYFEKITALRNGSGNNPCNAENNVPQGMTYDCQDSSYIQVGTFKNTNNEIFFMLVNRRASPVTEAGYDGRRLVRIRLKANFADFSNSGKWKITDLVTNTVKATFDKKQNNTIDLEMLMPGEFKLYKLSPQ
ncbi:MAG: hypothetical protein AB2L26_08780 [Ignavibacteria bacterium]